MNFSYTKESKPVLCIISAALGPSTAILLKNIVSVGYKQGIPVELTNAAYATGHLARSAGGESMSYSTETFVTFIVVEGVVKKGRRGARNPVNVLEADFRSLLL